MAVARSLLPATARRLLPTRSRGSVPPSTPGRSLSGATAELGSLSISVFWRSVMKHILLTALLFASGAWAEERQIEYSEKILPFAEWSAKFPQERNVLGLFKNY